MDGNAELLNFLYQNAQMGTETLPRIIELSQCPEFTESLKDQNAGYEHFYEEARICLHKRGYDEKGISTMDKITTYIMMNVQTMKDQSTSHLAEMVIQGSNMGMIQAVKKQNQYQDADPQILKLMNELQKFEEKNIERLKKFL